MKFSDMIGQVFKMTDLLKHEVVLARVLDVSDEGGMLLQMAAAPYEGQLRFRPHYLVALDPQS